ncbi:MAG TPA: sporulation integral membrane protein YlbJ [Bacillus bacterium]|uniref:Sporulation integral membrane protein YlbJ n=1 Tax=Siminovitchia fordii TaxID=254759 RepID=A0ABQ4JZV6_9BACI|nr:sporulation integral membrane protein YlbJ [Siminovitchia fordii]GIN19051.1 sporulation integral membrane protein YlbJ [Siminovitchia fordii]HBZ10334.1 sporulation integral membrane protein YlbJ [Bacillus sp. (in: firmicutes)]
MNFSKIKTIFLAAMVTLMAASMVLLPEKSFEASVRGLNMWWEIVFPSLFPFFVLSELLIGFGVVKFMGVLLEPLMRPLFRVPGVGGFAWAMGMASGFPAGAKITARLRQEGHLTRDEAERLVSFTNCSSPLFIFGAVSVGFFHNPQLGFLLALAHYIGNFSVGIIMRHFGQEGRSKKEKKTYKRPLLTEALSALHQTRLKNKKPIGKLVGDAVISSIHTLLMIGGFIILFSVVNKLLFHMHITAFLGKLVESTLVIFQMPASLSIPSIAGIFEITLGSQMTSQVHDATLMQQAIMASFILGFSGFSVQAQVASILAQTDIRFRPFFIARILHGFLSGLITYLFWKPFEQKFLSGQSMSVPAFLQKHDIWWENMLQWLKLFGPLFTILMLMICIAVYVQTMESKN